jgi:hypothetical protein
VRETAPEMGWEWAHESGSGNGMGEGEGGHSGAKAKWHAGEGGREHQHIPLQPGRPGPTTKVHRVVTSGNIFNAFT